MYNHEKFSPFNHRLLKHGGLFSLWLLVLLLAAGGCEARRDALLSVQKVFDGDTVLLSDGEKVRFIGIDCPEAYESEKLFRDARRTQRDASLIQAQGRKAKAVAARLVEGKRIILELDLEKRDRYGRLLAYVFIPLNQPSSPEVPESDLYMVDKDGVPCIFLNASLLVMGYAVPMTIPPNTRYADLFKTLHLKAREQKKGLWR